MDKVTPDIQSKRRGRSTVHGHRS